MMFDITLRFFPAENLIDEAFIDFGSKFLFKNQSYSRRASA